MPLSPEQARVKTNMERVMLGEVVSSESPLPPDMRDK
jgi:hypothetical protein